MSRYIGARYVPKFMGAYDPTQEYENMCVVDNGSGTSYISKKIVPPGTPLTDTTYWALYGAASGAIISLQDQIDDINNLKLIGTKPEAFGAVGDGITDDTAALQYALNTYKIVYLSDKIYKITSPLTVPEGVNLVGIGTILIDYLSAYDAIVLQGNNMIRGIKFTDTGNTFIKTNSVVTAVNTEKITISECSFDSIHLGYCIRIEYSDHIDICNNKIKEYSYSGIVLASTCTHARINQNSVINGNLSDSTNNRYPICVSAYGDIASNHGPAEYIECNYNYIEDANPLWEGIDSHGVNNAEFIGNTIIGTALGIVLTKPTNAGSLTNNGQFITIRDNHIVHDQASWSAYAKSGISVSVEHNLYNVTIENNYCELRNDSAITDITAATHEIVVSTSDASGTIMNVRINNNFIKQKGGGICLAGSSVVNSVEIHNNRISGLTLGAFSVAINLQYMSGSYSNVTVTGNYINTSDASAYSFRGNDNNSAHRMVKYRDNTDNGRYVDIKHCTCARSSYDIVTNNEGENGDFIPSNANSNVIGWFCIERGLWKQINA